MQHTIGAAAGVSKTGSLQQTNNYIWNTADALGRGATAIVYFGRNKSTGDVCAVKVFNERELRHQFTVRQREIETLRTLQHDNIVKLLALEKETLTGNDVVVMEYCSGGSLYNMLEQPQYAFGFPEIEFLLVLVHIAKGVQYLRSKNYIHRDIKPGNIMRYVAEDGRSLYKITDFGAARELPEDETFMSIYGTEEYLFPGMYERAVLRQAQPGNQVFDASVDIWSIGVTIYHVCTGQLPFQPYGGRSNAMTMHMITSTKPSGVISGVQKVPNGDIEWDRNLPETCQLSVQLQERITPMLAGLMELNPAKRWTFEQFFDVANELDNMLTLNVFCVASASQLPLSVHKTDTYAAIQEKVARYTNIPAASQLLLVQERDLISVVDPRTQVQTYPRIILHGQLFLFNKTSLDNCDIKLMYMPPFPNVDGHENLEADAQSAKKSLAVAWCICTAVKSFLDCQNLLAQGELFYRGYIKHIVWCSESIVPEMERTLNETRCRYNTFIDTFRTVIDLFDTLLGMIDTGTLSTTSPDIGLQIRQSVTQLKDCLQDETLNAFYEKINVRLNEIRVYVEVLSRKIVEQESERMKVDHRCAESDHCLSKAEYQKGKVMNVSTTMNKHRKYRDLHSHEQFIHKCEKQKQQECCVSMGSLANDHCKRNLQRCYKSTQREVNNLTKHLTRTKKVEQNVSSVKDCFGQLSTKLGEEEEKCRTITNKITRLMCQTLTSGTTPATMDQLRPSVPSGQSVGSVGFDRTPEGSERKPSFRDERPGVAGPSWSSGVKEDESGPPTKQRTMLLDKLTQELSSLQKDSEQLKSLVEENSIVMKKFLLETTNLHLDGSLDSDQRRGTPDDT